MKNRVLKGRKNGANGNDLAGEECVKRHPKNQNELLALFGGPADLERDISHTNCTYIYHLLKTPDPATRVAQSIFRRKLKPIKNCKTENGNETEPNIHDGRAIAGSIHLSFIIYHNAVLGPNRVLIRQNSCPTLSAIAKFTIDQRGYTKSRKKVEV